MNKASCMASGDQLHKRLLTGSLLCRHIATSVMDQLAWGCSDRRCVPPFPGQAPVRLRMLQSCPSFQEVLIFWNSSGVVPTIFGVRVCWQTLQLFLQGESQHLQNPFTEAYEKREGSGGLWHLPGAEVGTKRGGPCSLEPTGPLMWFLWAEHNVLATLYPNHLKSMSDLALGGQIPQVPLNFKLCNPGIPSPQARRCPNRRGLCLKVKAPDSVSLWKSVKSLSSWEFAWQAFFLAFFSPLEEVFCLQDWTIKKKKKNPQTQSRIVQPGRKGQLSGHSTFPIPDPSWSHCAAQQIWNFILWQQSKRQWAEILWIVIQQKYLSSCWGVCVGGEASLVWFSFFCLLSF